MLNEVRENLKQAMRNREMLKMNVFRSLITNIEVKEKEGKIIDEVEFQRTVKKMISQHEESLEAFRNVNREDLVLEEMAKIKILELYLPEMLSETQIIEITTDICDELSKSNDFNIGNAMKKIRDEYGTVMDMKIASQIVKNYTQ